MENLPNPPSAIRIVQPLGYQWPTEDPFLFCVHHWDRYPIGKDGFGPDPGELRGRMIGSDFEEKDGWRMYHGETVPGFPAHPHRGFETVTVVERGFVDHSDSLGGAARYGNGDAQWMSAGSGVVHSEMFPLLNRNTTENGEPDNTVELFQIWLNLPAQSKMTEPFYAMHWQEDIPVVSKTDANGKIVSVKLISGDYQSQTGLKAPPASWATDKENRVWIWVVDMPPHSEFCIPADRSGLNRNLYHYFGTQLQVEELWIPLNHRVGLESDREIQIRASENGAKFLLLQGRPIAEPIVQYGPFVMNSRLEIQQAYADYQNTGFGGWDWEVADVVHGMEGRFARYPDGTIFSR